MFDAKKIRADVSERARQRDRRAVAVIRLPLRCTARRGIIVGET